MRMRPHPAPSPDIMEQLSTEMENLIIEAKLSQEAVAGGPLRSVWESAVDAGRRNQVPLPSKCGAERDGEGTLPSPVSPDGGEKEGKGDGIWESRIRLPSPRPSPPPSLQRKGSSYVRARSVSY